MGKSYNSTVSFSNFTYRESLQNKIVLCTNKNYAGVQTDTSLQYILMHTECLIVCKQRIEC